MLGWVFGTNEAPNNQPDIEEIFTKYQKLMYYTASKFTRNPEDQKDIVQTAMVRLIRILSTHVGGQRCISAGYIVFVIRSVSVDFLRRRGREAEHIISIEDSQLAKVESIDGSLEDLIMASDSAERLWSLWPQLPAEDRILLEGKYILGYSDEELATILDCKSGSIRMKLTRARRRAFQLLSERNEL